MAKEKIFCQKKSFKYFVWKPLGSRVRKGKFFSSSSTTPAVPMANLPVVYLIPVANLPPVSLILVANLPQALLKPVVHLDLRTSLQNFIKI